MNCIMFCIIILNAEELYCSFNASNLVCYDRQVQLTCHHHDITDTTSSGPIFSQTSPVVWMKDGDRLPRLLMFSEMAEGKRNRGRPTFRWSDTLKAVLKWAGLPAYQDWATEVQSEDWRSNIRGYRENLCQSFQKWRDR